MMSKTTSKTTATKLDPVTVTVAGTTYPVAALGMPELSQLCTFAKDRRPSPLEAIKPHLDGLSPKTQRIMIDSALDRVNAPVIVGTPEFFGAVMQSTEGLQEAMWLSLKKGGADVTREACDEAAATLRPDQIVRVLAAAMGAF
jgi:hypothetical protein